MMQAEIHMIWARDPSDPEVVWLVDARDEFSIDNNQSGWGDAVEKARRENAEIRLTTSAIDFHRVEALFATKKIPLTEVAV